MTRDDGPFVVRLPRAPGERESRYAHLFGDDADALADSFAAAPGPDTELSLVARIERLEALVEELRAEVRRLGGEEIVI